MISYLHTNYTPIILRLFLWMAHNFNVLYRVHTVGTGPGRFADTPPPDAPPLTHVDTSNLPPMARHEFVMVSKQHMQD